MQQVDVVILLKKLSAKEMKDFHTYLRNRVRADSKALKLLAFLRKYHPAFDESKVNYEKASEHLFPQKAIKKNLISNLLSDIRLQLRTFLIEQHLKANPSEQDRLLLQIYRGYQLDHLFEKQLKTIEKKLDAEQPISLWHHFQKMQLNHEHYYYINTKRWNTRSSIYNAMKYLDYFYAAAKWTYASEIVNGISILGEPEANIHLLSEVENINLQEASEYHRFYRLAFHMIKTRSTDSFFKLKKKLLEQNGTIRKNDRFVILSYLLNHIAFEVHKGKDHFIEECFQLMKYGIQNDAFIINGIFDPNHFLNAIEVASNLQQFEWSWNFIAEWSSKLPPHSRDYYISLGIALIHFKMKDYHDCSDVLAHIDMKEPLDKQRGRWLKIIALYEINRDPNFTLDQCAAFEQFIRNNRFINSNRKKGILMAIKVLRLLLKPQPDKNKINQLLQTIENFHYKSWLEQKVQELK